MNTNICVVGHVMPMVWLQLHGLQCLVTVTAAVIAVVGGCAAAVAVVAAVAHTFLFTHTRCS